MKPSSQGGAKIPRVRAVDARNAPKAVSQEVDRYMELDQRITVAKLQDRIAKEAQQAHESRHTGRRMPPGNDGTKYPVALPIDLNREREYVKLKQDLCEDPAGVPLDNLITRTMDRKEQRRDLEQRLQPSIPTIGSQRQPWEYQLMLAQRHTDDGDGMHDDFFKVLDSKAAVSDALHRHHSTAELRVAVTHTFDDWVEDVQRQQPITNQEAADRLQDMQRDVAAVTESQRIVDETMLNITSSVDQLHGVHMGMHDISQRVGWAENNRLLAKQSAKSFARTRHVSTLTDLTFRTDLVDPAEDGSESDDGSAEETEDNVGYDTHTVPGSPVHSSVGRKGARPGGAPGNAASTAAVTDVDHNRQLAALERKLRQRYDAMMKMLKTAVAERRVHQEQEMHLKKLVDLRDTEIVRLRALYKGLVENQGFTALWDTAREELNADSALSPKVEAVERELADASGVEDTLRRIVEDVISDARRDGLFSCSGAPIQLGNDNFGIVLEEKENEDAEVYRELNDLKKEHAALKERAEALQSDGSHREEMYQRLNQRFSNLSQEHVNMEQVLAATEEDRSSKTHRLIEAEKSVRELSAKIAGFDRSKAEEFAQFQAQFDAEKALLDRRAADLEKDLQAIINKYEKNGGGDDSDESPEIKFRKANAKVQELETQVKTLKGLNRALEQNTKNIQNEVQQLIQTAVTFVLPLGEYLSAARSHLLGATTLRGMEATRVCVWSDLDALLSHCRNGFVQGTMKHSSDPIFAETIARLDQLLSVSLTEMEEDRGTKDMEKELHKMTQLNRELKGRLQRAEGELSHLRSNKAQVVDSVRAAACRIADEAEAAAADTLDLVDIPLASDGEDGSISDGDDAAPFDRSMSGRSPLQERSMSTPASGVLEDSTRASSYRFVGSMRSFRRASSVADVVRRRSAVAAHAEATPSPPPTTSAASTAAGSKLAENDPSLEGPAEQSVTATSPPPVESRRRSILLQSSRRRSSIRIVQGLPPGEGGCDAAGDARAFEPAHTLVVARSPSPQRSASVVSATTSSSDQLQPQLRKSSVRNDSKERSASMGSVVGAIFRDESTQQILDAAFGNMRQRMDDAIQQRDAAMSKAAALARDLQEQAVRIADEGAAVLGDVLQKARAACFALREVSGMYARSVLGNIDANRSRIWVPADAEPLLVEARLLPAQSIGLIKSIVRKTCLYQVRKDSYQRLLEGLYADSRDLGDVMTTGLWRRRMLHMEQRHSMSIASALDALTVLHQRRLSVLQRIESLVDMPKAAPKGSTGSVQTRSPPPTARQGQPSSMQSSPRGGDLAASSSTTTATPPPPCSSLSGPNSAPDDGDHLPHHSSFSTTPIAVEMCDACCFTSDGGCPHPLIPASVITTLMEVVRDSLGTYCSNGAAGQQNKTLEATKEFLRRRLLEDSVILRSGGLCGIAECDSYIYGLSNDLQGQLSDMLGNLASFQSRVESEAYMRFVASAAPQPQPDEGKEAFDRFLDVLDETIPPDDVETTKDGADVAAEQHDTTTEKGETLWKARYHQLDAKHKHTESTLKDTKLQFRKLLKAVSADRFAHIETRPWLLDDVLKMHRNRIVQLLSSSTGAPGEAEQRVVACPCPVCGKVIVSSPQKPLGKHGPLQSNACTETVEMLVDNTTAVPEVEEMVWHQTCPTGSTAPYTRTVRPLPSSSIGMAADSNYVRTDVSKDMDDALYIPSFGRQGGGVVSPLTWNIHSPAPSLDHEEVFSGPRPAADEVVVLPHIGDVPLLRFTPRVSTSVSCSTQTDPNLVATMLLDLLHRLPQVVPLPLRHARNVDETMVDPAVQRGPVTLATVRDRLWKFSHDRRVAIANEIASQRDMSMDGSMELLGEGLGPLPHRKPEERVQARVSHAVVARRALSPTFDDRSVSVDGRSDCSMMITSAQVPSCAIGMGARIGEESTFRSTLSAALQRTGSAQRSADVHRRLPSATRVLSSPPVSDLGVVGQRPPSAGPGPAANHARPTSCAAHDRKKEPVASLVVPVEDPNEIQCRAPTAESREAGQRPMEATDRGSTHTQPTSHPHTTIPLGLSRPSSGAAGRGK